MIIRVTPIYKVNAINSIKTRGEDEVKMVGVRIRDEDKNYLEEIAASLDLPLSWVLRKMLEYAIKKHKAGEFELWE